MAQKPRLFEPKITEPKEQISDLIVGQDGRTALHLFAEDENMGDENMGDEAFVHLREDPEFFLILAQ